MCALQVFLYFLIGEQLYLTAYAEQQAPFLVHARFFVALVESKSSTFLMSHSMISHVTAHIESSSIVDKAYKHTKVASTAFFVAHSCFIPQILTQNNLFQVLLQVKL